MTSVAVVDPHVMLAQAIAAQLRARRFDAQVLDVGRPIVAQTEAIGVDVVLLDRDLGHADLDGAELIEQLSAAGTPVVVLTSSADRLTVADALIRGASAVLSKSLGFDDLVEAIEAAAGRGEMIHPTASDRVGLISDYLAHERNAEARRAPFERLTPREEDVLEAMMSGSTCAEISAQQFVSISTVRTHVKSIMRKLEVGGQLKAVALANEVGWHGQTHGEEHS